MKSFRSILPKSIKEAIVPTPDFPTMEETLMSDDAVKYIPKKHQEHPVAKYFTDLEEENEALKAEITTLQANFSRLQAELGASQLMVAQLRNDTDMADKIKLEAVEKYGDAKGLLRVIRNAIESWEDNEPVPLPRKKKKEKNHDHDPALSVEPTNATGTEPDHHPV